MTNPDLPRQHPNITLAVLAIGGMAFSLLQSLVSPALPEIQHALGTTEAAVSWVLTGYLLSAAVATPIVGRLGDMFGKEKMLMFALIALMVGSALAALANSITVLVGARVIQGLAAGIFPLAFGIIRDEFPREKVAGSIGLMSALLGIGGGAGVVLSGVIVDNLSYHWLFWFPLIIVALTAVLTHFYIPESPIKTPGKINWVGAGLMSLGLAGFLLAISKGAEWGWGSVSTLGLLAASAVLLRLWIRNEFHAEEPLVDMKMMKIKGVWTTNTVAALMGVGMYASFILVPQLVLLPKDTGYGFGATVTAAGLFLLPSTVTMLLGGAASGRLEARFGSKPPLIAGASFAAASFLWLAVAHTTKLDIYLSSALLGLGIGLSFAAMANLIVQAVPQEQTGVATGMNTVMRSVGGAIGAQAVATILTQNIAGGVPSEHGFIVAFSFGAVALVGAAAIGLLIPTTHPDRQAPASPSAPAREAGVPAAVQG